MIKQCLCHLSREDFDVLGRNTGFTSSLSFCVFKERLDFKNLKYVNDLVEIGNIQQMRWPDLLNGSGWLLTTQSRLIALQCAPYSVLYFYEFY